jgi:predicted HNH restriction endonuclease
MPVSVAHIIEALSSLGGEAHLNEITERVKQIAPKPHPYTIYQVIRARLQERCAEAKSYKGIDNLFESVHGVEARKGVWRLRSDSLDPSNRDGVQDGAEAFFEDEEGRAELRIHLRRERSRKLIVAFKNTLAKFECVACGFNFGARYGSLGEGYIEAHHTIPVASLPEGGKTKICDLVALCANCHRMIHTACPMLSVDELRALLRP